jgi:hypothetical protein
MEKNNFILAPVIFITVLTGCKTGNNNPKTIYFDSIKITSTGKKINTVDTVGQGLPIFYNMYLSVELSSLFETAGAVFKDDLMNSTEGISSYITSSQQAINLGVYAVDLSYARVFDQAEVAGKYFSAMQQLANELGIPGDYFENTAKRFERNITNKDSLIKIANEVYTTTDEFLKDNERYTTASLIIVGGWVEAIYIALDVAVESQDPEIIERLMDQKYSLNNLISMLSDYKDSEVINEYLGELTKIKNQFDLMDINFTIDFNPQKPTDKKYLEGAIQKIVKFRTYIDTFRNKLVK